MISRIAKKPSTKVGGALAALTVAFAAGRYDPHPKAKINNHYSIGYANPGTAPGSVKDSWTIEYDNIVPDVALNKILDDTYKTKTPDANFYIGLITGPGAAGCAAGDTMASHAGWVENVTYSDTTRPAWTPGSVSGKSVSNSASAAVFNVNGSATVGGAFLLSGVPGTANTKAGTGGTIRSCGPFSTGDKAVTNGGTLTVTITATAS